VTRPAVGRGGEAIKLRAQLRKHTQLSYEFLMYAHNILRDAERYMNGWLSALSAVRLKSQLAVLPSTGTALDVNFVCIATCRCHGLSSCLSV
jgi:hypothetical protein